MRYGATGIGHDRGLIFGPALGTGGGSLLSRVSALFDGGTYPGFMFKASRFGEGFFYQESIGVGLVTAAGQSIGLAMDSSRMGALGASAFIAAQPEIISNGSFDSGIDGWGDLNAWTAGSAVGVDGEIVVTVSSYQGAAQLMTGLTIGALYRVSATVISATGGDTGRLYVGSANNPAFPTVLNKTSLTAGAYDLFFVATSTEHGIGLSSTSGGNTVTWDNISVKEVLGYHGLQSTSNSRPTLQQPSGYAMRFDGIDDYLATALNPQSSGALIFGGTMDAVGDLVMGSNGGASDRCFIGTNASGYLGAGIGSDSYSTIAGSTDITGVDGFNSLRWNGATVSLNRDDTGTPVYSAGQNGSPVNSRPIYVGGYNNAGTAGLFADADIDFFFAIMGRELSNADLALIKAYRES